MASPKISANVGADIINILTESLYDRPIVVFREYVQNSIDAIYDVHEKNKSDVDCEIKINFDKNTLSFLDNASGIKSEEFSEIMLNIARSPKSRERNIGYKGIGRLSGIPYCKKLRFINIIDYKNKILQEVSFSGERYTNLKYSKNIDTYDDLIEEITDENNYTDFTDFAILETHKDMFNERNTGFLVVLENVSTVLFDTINRKDFFEELGWLLPVGFKSELYSLDGNQADLFKSIENYETPAIKSYDISYNDCKVERPITKENLRYYDSIISFDYGHIYTSFANNKMVIDTKNSFRGIKIYIDNMLLCDENEIISALSNYSLLSTTTSEALYAARAVGAIIYITDKTNIFANARRTFIEVADDSAINFMHQISKYITNIHLARYALSKYATFNNNSKKNEEDEKEQKLKEEAKTALSRLVEEKITVEIEKIEKNVEYTPAEKKRIIKKQILSEINKSLTEYLKNLTDFDDESPYKSFKSWITKN